TPFSTDRPGRLPTTIETVALAVWVGLFQATTPVFATTVFSATLALRTARNRSATPVPGASAPVVAAKLAVMVEPAKLTPAGEPFIVADPLTYESWPSCEAFRS